MGPKKSARQPAPQNGSNDSDPQTDPHRGSNPQSRPQSAPHRGQKRGSNNGPNSRPQSEPQSEPQSNPHFRPQSGQQSEPQSKPQSGPHSNPRSGPHSRPQSGPQSRSAQQSGPQSRPQSRPHSGPRNPHQNPHPPARTRLLSECGDDHCPLCLNRISIFAIGQCNHAVCADCSARMRVLCAAFECAICRQEMKKVVHTTTRLPFSELEHDPRFHYDRKFRICFENDSVRGEFYRLLEHPCPVCEEGDEKVVFRTFKQLDQHIRREHEKFYCELCFDFLKLFTHERRHYSRSGLATHRRKGEADDTSHKGHPLCEFCETRYFDKDELYRHLRKDHFFCHFCDADGLQQFYNDYPALRDHFAAEHFVCTEGECRDVQFTSAFRSDIDLKAHRAEHHSNMLSKSAAKQNRIVGLDINYSRPNRDQVNRRRGQEPSPPENNIPAADEVDSTPDWSAENFPSLSGRASNPVSNNWSGAGIRTPRLEEDFPSLPGSRPAPKTNSARPTSNYVNGARKKEGAKKPGEDFPSLGGPSKPLPNFRPQKTQPIYKKPAAPPQPWVESVAKTKSEVREQPKPTQTGNMTVLSKKSERFSEEYPGLQSPSKPVKPVVKPVKANKTKPVIKTTQPTEKTNLKTAANLISVEPKIDEDKENERSRPLELPSGLSQKFVKDVAKGAIPGLDLERLSIKDPVPEHTSNISVIRAEDLQPTRPTSNYSAKPPSKDDFPSLGKTSKKMNANFRNAGGASKNNNSVWSTGNKKTAPPGFTEEKKKPTPPPPGFSKKKIKNATYYQPADFADRNKKLLVKLTDLIGAKSLEFGQFKDVSGRFRAGGMGSREYFDKCLDLLEEEKFKKVFPDLLVLLPDIKKQQELLKLHQSKFGNLPSSVLTCPRCDQIILDSDSPRHSEWHEMDSDFPVLG